MSGHIPLEAFKQHIAILGKAGSGKTYTAKGLVEGMLDRGERVCIIDPTDVWWGLKSAYPVIAFGGKKADLPLGSHHGETLADAIGISSTPAIIVTADLRTGERVRFFTDFAEGLLRKNKGPLHLIIDEAHIFAPQGKVPDPQSGAMLHAANNLVALGRARGLRITMITQRPAKLHKDSLTQIETLIALRLIAPQDRSAVQDWIKDQADVEKGKEIIASLATLKTGTGWVWAPEIGILKKVSFPKIKTFDSSRAPDEADKVKGPSLKPIDLEAMQGRLEAVMKEAVDKDPAVLKKKIAELTKQLSSNSRDSYHADLKKAYEDGKEEGRKASELKISETVKSIISELNKAIYPGGVFIENAKAKIEARTLSYESLGKPKFPSGTKPDSFTPEKTATGRIGYNKPQERILRSLHFWHVMGEQSPTREQVAGVAGYKPGSGGFNNLVGFLRTSGLITVGDTAGTLALVSVNKNLEMTGEQAREKLLSVLSNPHKKIVDALMEGDVMTREEVAKKSGYAVGSGGFNNLVGKLNTLAILERPGVGMLALSGWAREVLA